LNSAGMDIRTKSFRLSTADVMHRSKDARHHTN
jgi:hypothetical protein